MTLKLDLRSHAPQNIPVKQGGVRRVRTDLPPERDLDPAQWLIAQLPAIVGLDVGLLMDEAN
jgi:hypothetical protein